MAYNSEPRNLTQTAMWETSRPGLDNWARGYCLLEHLDDDEIDQMSKKALIDEIMGVMLRIEVSEEHRAAALDTKARSVAEVIGFSA